MTTSASEHATSLMHDFRSPLAAIHAGAELLMRTTLSGTQMRIARSLYHASVRIEELMEEFFERSKGTAEELTSTEFHALARAAAAEVAPAADLQSVTIIEDVPRGLEVGVDGRRIHRVLVNLLVNALEVMPGGGAVHISARSEASAVLVRVRDTGPGIAPEIRDRLFQPLATWGKPGGIGLGLACARKAVIEGGGEMWAESPSEGACFVLRLPAPARAQRPSDGGAPVDNAADRWSREQRFP
jgi:signal transduction histidine kinase